MILTFAHQKGGVGKSTLCLNIALILSDTLKVAIADLDPQGSLRDVSQLIERIDFITLPETFNDLKKLPYDLICVDTPPYLSDRLPELFCASDIVIIPTKPGTFDVLAIRRTVETVKNTHTKAGIVLNMVKAGSKLTDEAEQVLREYGITIFNTFISDLVTFARSPLTAGVTGNAKKQIEALTTEILTFHRT